MAKKKVVIATPVEPIAEQDEQEVEQQVAPEPTAAAEPEASTEPSEDKGPKKRRQYSATPGRQEALRKANEARLRKKIEREKDEEDRRKREQELEFDRKVQEKVQQYLKKQSAGGSSGSAQPNKKARIESDDETPQKAEPVAAQKAPPPAPQKPAGQPNRPPVDPRLSSMARLIFGNLS
jgi:hypothetical protein